MVFDMNAVKPYFKLTLTFPPAVIGWNRLEGRPRTEQFDRALRAEARDALWFLTRQWQFGEYKGEDAGSPVEARTAVRVDPLQHYAVTPSAAVAYESELPLETHVEREAIPFDLTTHAQVTRYFWRLIAGVSAPATARERYLQRFPLGLASIAGIVDDDARRVLQIAGRRTLDAGALIASIDGNTHDAVVDGFAGLSAADRTGLKKAGRDLQAWFRFQYSLPTGPTDEAWKPRFLEYQFACATDAPVRGQTVLRANQYAQGHLDWFAFDVEVTPGTRLVRADGSAPTTTAAPVKPLSFIPAPVAFGGMPSHRYWEMESRQIEFANIDAHTTDVAKLLLTEFALVYGNDWCVIPYELPVGTLSEVVGILVTDDFGEQSLLLPAGRGREDQWQRWSMFTLSLSAAGHAADTRLLLPPAVGKLLEGPPLEKVLFLRDEMANMAWGVERVVASALGRGLSGYDAARMATAAVPAPAPPHATTAPVRYVLGTDVPQNWHPFVPVHVPGSSRSVQLQRGRLPGPHRERRTRILDVAKPYYINEEEVPRAGKVVTRGFQRARWFDGATFVWLGRRAATGRGEGSSGLAFDQVVDTPRSGA
jgi:hypothetical protein